MIYNIAKPAQFERLISKLWQKHGTPDKHEYIDWMGENGFGNALAEFADGMANGTIVNLPTRKRRTAAGTTIARLWQDYAAHPTAVVMSQQQFEAACIELLERVKNGEVKL